MIGCLRNLPVRLAVLAIVATGFTCGKDPVPPENKRPVAVGMIPDTTLVEGDVYTRNIAAFFDDPDDDALNYTALSSNATVAAASMSGATLTVRAVAEGTATVTITATDPDGLSATQSFGVTVERPNRAPVAVGEVPPVTMFEGEVFVAPVSLFFNDPDGDELTYAATSSDTEVVTTAMSSDTITVTAVAPGMATITVTATDPDGLSATQTAEFTVEKLNRAPVLADTIPHQTLTEGDTLVLDVSDNFSDPDGDTLTFTAESDDTTAVTVSVDGSEVTIVAVAVGSGAFVSVTASDPDSLSVTQAFNVAVEEPNRAPMVADTIPDQTLTEGDTIMLDVSGNFVDPDGDTLVFTAESDDTTAVTVSVDGSEVTIVAVAVGSASVSVTASDPDSLSVTQAFNVEVEEPNRAPMVADTIPDQTLTEGDTIMLDVSGNFVDPDGDTLVYMAESDDTTAVTVSVDGSEVTIVAVAVGSASVSVTASDPDSLSVTQAFNVEVEEPNRAPMVADTIPDQTLTEGDTIMLDVSGNFVDPDGDTLVYMAESDDTTAVTVSVDGSEVTIVAVAVGSASVSVTASDPDSLSVTQAFNVEVEEPNRAPMVADTIPDQTLTEGDTIMLDVSGNFVDPDGDTLVFTAESDDTTAVTVSVDGSEVTIVAVAVGSASVSVTASDPDSLSVTQAFNVEVEEPNRAPMVADTIPDQTLTEGDTIMLDVSGNFVDPDGDTLVFTAESDDSTAVTVSVDGSEVTIVAVAVGSASVSVTATDPDSLSVTQAFNVEVEEPNRAPMVADTIPDQTLTEGDTIMLDVSGNFVDPDGDTLVYMAESDDTTAVTVSVDGSEVTIVAVAVGSASVSVTASDPDSLSVTQAFNVEVEEPNRAPMVADTIPDQTLTEGDTIMLDVSGNFVDPDGDTLVYMAESDDTTAVTVSVDGSEVTIVAVAVGSASVSVTASDPDSLSVTQAFNVEVEEPNRAPMVADTIPDQTLTEGDTIMLDVSGNFVDPDGDTLVYMAESDDTTAVTVSVDGSEVTIVAVAVGSASVSVTASDPDSLSVTQAFNVEVEGPNQAPMPADTIPDQTLTEGDTIMLDVSGNFVDPDGDTLVYMAESSSMSVAMATVSGSTVTIVARAPGRATVTVTATDPDDLSATQEFGVGVAAPLPLHDLFIVVDTAGDVDTLTQVVLDMAGYFGDTDSVFEYDVEFGRDEVAKVDAVDGTVVTIEPLEVDTAVIDDEVLFDTTTVSVTATDEDGLSVTQTTLVRVAPVDYEAWVDFKITEEGNFELGGFAMSVCFDLDGLVVGETVYTVHRSEWQVQKGTGWVQVIGTYVELKVCPYDDLPDESPGTFRLVGEVTTWPADTADTDPGDTMRVLRKSENEIIVEDERPPPRGDLASAAYAAPGRAGGEPQRARAAGALTPPRRSGLRRPVRRSRHGCSGPACARTSSVRPPSARRARHRRR